MKTLVSLLFAVAVCCLLSSSGMAADAAVKASAVSGIALTTHRPGGGDGGFGVGPATFGEIVRHDIKDNRVVGSRVIYPGKARAAVIDPSGERVVFIKLDGRLHVMKADGSDLKELSRTRNRNASAVAWPTGDWVYYSEEGHSPTGGWVPPDKEQTPEKRSIRRVNVVSGEDEEVGAAPSSIWQLSLALASGKGSGRYAITWHLADLSQPDKAVNARKLECGTMVSPSGQYVTEMQGTHADLNIWSWDLGTLLTEFRVNAWAGASGDGRNYLYRPRWSANSDKWVVMTHGVDFGCTERSNAALYNWKEQIQIQLTRNPLDGKASDEGESFWVAGLPVDFSVIELEGKAPYTIELKSPKVDGEGWKWDFGDGATGSGAVGRHTYTKPGDYIATARKGPSALRQRVLVLPRKGPRATTVSALDPRHVLVVFEEAVTFDGAKEKGLVDPSTLPPAPAVNPKKAVPGLQVAYYVGGDLDSALNIDARTPAKTGTVSVIDLAFAEAKEWFGLKFTGYIHVPKDGEYTFFTNSDDGSRLYIGNTEVVNNDGMHGAGEVSGRIRLEAGKHPIRVYFMQGGGGSVLSVSYEGPGIAKSQIPSQAFFRDEEPVTIDGTTVKLASGRAATSLYLDTLGRQLVAEFDQPLAAKETLVLEGITDRAQVPNAVANPRLPVQRPSWPADATGLVFLWKNAKAENRIWDPVLGGVRETLVTIRSRESARFDRLGTAMTAGGMGFIVNPQAPALVMYGGIHKTKQFSCEIVVASADLTQTKGNDDKPLAIVYWGWTGVGQTGLFQEKGKLLAVLSKQRNDGNLEVFEMATLPDTKPRHVIISWDEKRLACYVDGKKVKEIDPSPATLLTQPGIRFADNGWRGTFEYVAMYNRFIEEHEAAKNAATVAAELAQRKPIDRVVVDARLTAKTPAPEPKDMMPYSNALVVYEYAVQKVKDGKAIKDGQVVRVAHWGVRDLKKTPAAERAVGSTFPLTLERFADHPDLEAEFMRDDLPVSEADLWTDGQP